VLKDHKLISAGVVLATGIVATAALLSDDPASPCLDHRAVASMACTTEPPHMADEPEHGDPEPLQAQRSPMVTASSTVMQLSARATIKTAGGGPLTLSSAA
jgi:hypothetical protein